MRTIFSTPTRLLEAAPVGSGLLPYRSVVWISVGVASGGWIDRGCVPRGFVLVAVVFGMGLKIGLGGTFGSLVVHPWLGCSDLLRLQLRWCWEWTRRVLTGDLVEPTSSAAPSVDISSTGS
ncbi:hypothetical protein AKJ16_DCAP16997 [Drosera capensis]